MNLIYKLYQKINEWGYILTYCSSDPFKPAKRRLIKTVLPYTMIPYQKLSFIYNLAEKLIAKKVEGAYVECGVWNGGLSALCGTLFLKENNRSIWLFDSWEGAPQPQAIDTYMETGEKIQKGLAKGSEDQAKEILFDQLHFDAGKTHMVKGWFQDTLPEHKKDIGKIALCVLDCNLYESMKCCLENLFSQLADDGVIIIDDYDFQTGVRTAVDEFAQKHHLKITTIPFFFTLITTKSFKF